MKPKILITSSSFYKIPLYEAEDLKQLKAHFTVVSNPTGRRLTEPELIQAAHDCIGIIAGLEPYTDTVLQALPKLRCISRDGVGMDNIDLVMASKCHITVTNTAQAPTQAVAELTVGLMLALLRQIPTHHQTIIDHRWEQPHGHQLAGKTVGILGLGQIGKTVATLLQPFGCTLIGNDLNPDHNWGKAYHVQFVSKPNLYRRCDILTVHVSLNPQSRYLINDQVFKRLKPGSFFLNLSRGLVVKERDLIAALHENRLAGAALDVFEQEPYQGPLTDFPNVILTPHIGASTYQSRKKMQQQAIKNLISTLTNS